jgi:hypothetical protein
MGTPVYSYATQFLVYLEGLKVGFHRFSVSAQLGSTSHAQVEFTFAPAAIQLRPHTVCEIFFRDAGGVLRRLFMGELVGKGYGRDAQAPTFNVLFKGVSTNFDRTTVAIAANTPPFGSVGQAGLLPGDHLLFVAGDTGSGGAAGSGAGASTANADFFKNSATPAISNIILDSFFEAFGLSPKSGDLPTGGAVSFNFQKAIVSAFTKYITPGLGTPGGANITSGSTSTFFSIANSRFGLIDGIDGVTSAELAKAYFTDNPQLVKNFIFGISNSIAGRYTVLQAIRMYVESSFHIITDYDVAPPLFDDGRIPTLLFFPDLKYADPPVCNIFLPQMIVNHNFNTTVEKPTRIISSQVPAYNNTGTVISILPIALSKASFSTAQSTKGAPLPSYQKNNYISQEEIEVGVSPTFAVNLSPALDQPELLPAIAQWLGVSNPIRWLERRAAPQNGTVTMSFNPYVAIGMPCAIVDGEIITDDNRRRTVKPGTGVGVIRGQVIGVQHSASPTGGTTSVRVGSVFFSDDAIEIKPEGLDLDDGFTDGFAPAAEINKMNIFDPNGSPQNPDEVYKQLLGVRSATQAGTFPFDVSMSILDLAYGVNSVEAALLLNARAIPSIAALLEFYEGKSVFTEDRGVNFSDLTRDEVERVGPLKLPYESPYIALIGGSIVTTDKSGDQSIVATSGSPSTPDNPKLQDRREAVRQYIIELESF